MGEMRNTYNILVVKPEGKRLVGRVVYRWENNIKMELKDIGCDSVYWFQLFPDKVQCQAVVNLPVP
jgi:hypothetical protein